jgi:hypothetical protein
MNAPTQNHEGEKILLLAEYVNRFRWFTPMRSLQLSVHARASRCFGVRIWSHLQPDCGQRPRHFSAVPSRPGSEMT